MAKKAKGNRVQVILECTEMKESGLPGTSRYITRVQVILECTEMKESGLPGTSRYITTKNRKNTTERLELKKYNPILKRVTVHKEIK